MFAIAMNTPVITFATMLIMFTGWYSPVNMPEMLQSAHSSCKLHLNVTQDCAELIAVSAGISGNAGACAYFPFKTVNNNIKKFIRKTVEHLISWRPNGYCNVHVL
jgi:hypothetical protein